MGNPALKTVELDRMQYPSHVSDTKKIFSEVLCKSPNLSALELSLSFRGESHLPDCLWKSEKLVFFRYIRNNELSGKPKAQNYFPEEVLRQYKVSFNASASGGFRHLTKLVRFEISSLILWFHMLEPTSQGAAFLSWNTSSWMNTGMTGPLPATLPPRLISINLDLNYLGGRIPNQWCEASALLALTLNLMPNLRGPLPACFGRRMKVMTEIVLIGNPGLDGPIPWDSLSVKFRSNQTRKDRRISPLERSSQVLDEARMTHLILANNNLSGQALPARDGAGDEAFAEEWSFTVAENGAETNVGNASNTKYNRCSLKILAVSENPHLSGEIHPGIVHCKDLLSLYLHGTDVSGNIPAEMCGNCYFGVLTLHNISAFEGDNETQVAKRRAFRRDCSRAKTEAYAACVDVYKRYDVSDRNVLAPFMVTRVTDADGTWDCGGNLSMHVSGPNPERHQSNVEYDGCVFRPTKLRSNLPSVYNLPPEHAPGPERGFGFWYKPDREYYYPFFTL
jgi:hypothetical protein